MSLIRSLLFIALLSFVPFCFSIDQFRCKAVPGCKIARCDPTAYSLANLERNEFPISCVSDDASKENINNNEVKKLKGKVADLTSELERVWDMNKLQNEDMKRMRKQAKESNKEISELVEKNKNLENDLKLMERKIAELSETNVTELREGNKDLEDKFKTLKQNYKDISKINVTKLQETVEHLEEKLKTFEEISERNVTELQERNKNFENDLDTLEKNIGINMQQLRENFENDLTGLKKKFEQNSGPLAPRTTSATLTTSKADKETTTPVVPKSCRDVKILDAKRKTKSGGVYDIYVEQLGKEIEVSCDLTTDGGGWTVLQRRMDGSENFYRGWNDYVKGFGRKDKEFWLGLENIHQMTKNGEYELRVDLGAFDGTTAFAKYRWFSIESSAVNYRLNIALYHGTAPDALGNDNGRPFTTKDRDNDEWGARNCAVNRHGAWWYRACGLSNLNGLYHDKVGSGWSGVYWLVENPKYLKSTEIKFRRVK